MKAFEQLLESLGCHRLVVGRDTPAARQPVLQIRDLMRKADAVIVLAFTRHIVKKAVEKPDADDPSEITKRQGLRHPTIWNQIEAGIGFGLGRPLLVFVEEGLTQEAMLKDRLEFRTIIRPFALDVLQDDEVKKKLKDFVAIARRRSWFRL